MFSTLGCDSKFVPDGPETNSRLEVPRASSADPFFDVINAWSDGASIIRLSEKQLSGDNLEIRVWIGFGIYRTTGARLRRINNVWLADYLGLKNVPFEDPRPRVVPVTLTERKAAQLWRKLQVLGITDFSKTSRIDPEASPEGIGYVIEFADATNYRIRRYLDPESSDSEAMKNVISIAETLHAFLNVNLKAKKAWTWKKND